MGSATATTNPRASFSLNTSSNSLAIRAAEIQTSLTEAMARASLMESNTPAGMPSHDAVVCRGLLQRIVRIYQQQLSDLAELESANSSGQNWLSSRRIGPDSLRRSRIRLCSTTG